MFFVRIQSLRNKIEEIDLALSCSRPDILCITEHWLNKGEEKIIKLDDYDMATAFCRENITKGGSAIFVRESMRYMMIDVKKLERELDFECSAVKVDNLIILCVYRSPNGNVGGFFRKFRRVFQKVQYET